jgi:UDP-N-acetylmuramyl pentapeptide phosphotransferase/UDP-N-acetylglucosamine-1-phosphate transferase
MKTLAIVLIAIGALMTIFTGFNFTKKEKVVDVGPLEINKEEKTPIAWSPILGGVLLVAGIVILVTSKRNTV